MLNIPLPFVIALFLVVLLARLATQRDRQLFPVMSFVAACTALVTIVGLRWSYELPFVRFAQPVVACVLPPLAWSLFSGLTQSRNWAQRLPHAVPVGLVLALSALAPWWRSSIDAILTASYFGYGLALLHFASSGADRLVNVRFSDAPSANRAALGSGAMLIVSGAVDLLIAGDFFLNHGTDVRPIIAVASLITLSLLACAVTFVGQTLPVSDDLPDPPPVRLAKTAGPTASDTDIVTTIDRLIRDKQLYRDPELTLNRLARKALIPTRQISGAINRVLGQNVSQLVNAYRVEEAKRLLQHTDQPITSIMFDAGFQTKSNFNHAFLRAVEKSPSDFRRSNVKVQAGQPTISPE